MPSNNSTPPARPSSPASRSSRPQTLALSFANVAARMIGRRVSSHGGRGSVSYHYLPASRQDEGIEDFMYDESISDDSVPIGVVSDTIEQTQNMQSSASVIGNQLYTPVSQMGDTDNTGADTNLSESVTAPEGEDMSQSRSYIASLFRPFFRLTQNSGSYVHVPTRDIPTQNIESYEVSVIGHVRDSAQQNNVTPVNPSPIPLFTVGRHSINPRAVPVFETELSEFINPVSMDTSYVESVIGDTVIGLPDQNVFVDGGNELHSLMSDDSSPSRVVMATHLRRGFNLRNFFRSYAQRLRGWRRRNIESRQQSAEDVPTRPPEDGTATRVATDTDPNTSEESSTWLRRFVNCQLYTLINLMKPLSEDEVSQQSRDDPSCQQLLMATGLVCDPLLFLFGALLYCITPLNLRRTRLWGMINIILAIQSYVWMVFLSIESLRNISDSVSLFHPISGELERQTDIFNSEGSLLRLDGDKSSKTESLHFDFQNEKNWISIHDYLSGVRGTDSTQIYGCVSVDTLEEYIKTDKNITSSPTTTPPTTSMVWAPRIGERDQFLKRKVKPSVNISNTEFSVGGRLAIAIDMQWSGRPTHQSLVLVKQFQKDIEGYSSTSSAHIPVAATVPIQFDASVITDARLMDGFIGVGLRCTPVGNTSHGDAKWILFYKDDKNTHIIRRSVFFDLSQSTDKLSPPGSLSHTCRLGLIDMDYREEEQTEVEEYSADSFLIVRNIDIETLSRWS